MTSKEKKTPVTLINILLIIAVILIGVLPLAFLKHSEFGGSDNQAENTISSIKPEYKPWFKSIWTPPSSEIESLLFALQAGVGCLIIGYYIGYARGRKKGCDSGKK